MNNFPFRIVGFDLDGTLLDTAGDLGAALNHALELAGRRRADMDEVRSFVGGGARKMLANALLATGGAVDDARLEELHDALLVFYSAHISDHTCLFPGGQAMLEALAENGVKLAVVTNKLEKFAVRILDALGLSDRFYTVIGGDTLGKGRAKPAPDLIHLMIERGGPGPVAFIGDTTYDVRAAKAAGVPCVAVSFGFNDRAPADLGADVVIDHFDELLPALQCLGASLPVD